MSTTNSSDDERMQVSVDDRRALWALTTRHVRSRTFSAVLLVRAALRADARHITLHTGGQRLRVDDDGAPRDQELAAIVDALRAPAVPALHALESRFGTDLLVATATAEHATISSGGRVVVVAGGAVVSEGSAPRGKSETVIELRRPASLRRAPMRWLHAAR